uniref:Uncharacterized protein n=1 Tax=Anguilla anguilla TaxID=7936 RepID=A0A0E9RI98_ANGAN
MTVLKLATPVYCYFTAFSRHSCSPFLSIV